MKLKPTPEFKRGVRAAIRCINQQLANRPAVRHCLQEKLSDLIVKRTKDGSAAGQR